MAAGSLNERKRELLTVVPIFRGIGGPTLDALVAASTTRHLDAHEPLFREGEKGSQLYIVMRGRLRIFVSSSGGREVVFTYADPGDAFGEIAVLDEHPRSASVAAIEASELLTLQRRDLLDVLRHHAGSAIQLAEALAAMVRRLSGMAEAALALPVPARLARRLLELDARYGQHTAEGSRLELRMSQQELGDMLGITRESVNKHLGSWGQQAVVRVDHGRITILDRETLESIARVSTL